MTFTYVDPTESTTHAVRFMLGDTRTAEAQFSDEEIDYAIERWLPLYGTLEWVASTLADTAAARYAREVSYSADGVSIGLGAVYKQYLELGASLRQQHKNALVGAQPDAGGMDLFDELYPDIRNFNFGTGMHDDMEAGPQDYGSRGKNSYVPENEPGV